jgi:hypothetical protein
MSLINSTAIPSGASAYEIGQSLRFEDGSSANLSKTFASAGNRRTWSFSVWFKRGNIGGTNNAANKDVFLGGINDGNMVRIADDQLQWYVWDGSADYGWISTAFVRDTSAWYHALFVFNTTSGTATHRQRIYLNGVELTDKATDYGNPPQNYDGLINTAGLHTIGKGIVNEEFDGYLAEVNFVDGQALTPSDFGETGDYGEWKPIEYEGSYGTNGFYLPFSGDAITATGGTIGTYTSGGVNYKYHQFTSSGNFEVTSAPTGSNVDILVVGGGAGGGRSFGGAGGAGGMIDRPTLGVSAGTYTMTIGGGGAGAGSGTPGDNGTDTTVAFNASTILTAKGGGGGAVAYANGIDGGSGGGGARSGGSNRAGGSETQTGQSGDSGTYGYGNDGGAVNLAGGDTPAYPTGGGGGAGAVGGTVSSGSGASGVGGVGRQNAYNGTNHYWAGGGGGMRYDTTGSAAAGAGGLGGGGGGAHHNAEGAGGAGGGSALNSGATGAQELQGGGAGGANTGGGGGGSSGDGGSGIVIVRYAV